MSNTDGRGMPAVDHRDPAWLWRGRVPCLDGLRAVSIAFVVLGHAASTEGAPAWLDKILGGRGGLGVEVFFTISGFLITLLLLREWRQTSTVSMRLFYLRRTLRIVPAFLVFLLGMAVAWRLGWVSFPATDWIFALTYTMNFPVEHGWDLHHLWSLSIEEQFYVVWPLTLLLLGPGRAKGAVIVVLLTAPVLRLVTYFLVPEHLGAASTWTHVRIDYIAAGCLLAMLAVDGNAWLRAAASRPRWVMPLLAAMMAGLFVSVLLVQRVPLIKWSVGLSAKAAFIAAIVWICATNGSTLVGKILEARPMVLLGVLSYSLYLWQQPFLNAERDEWACQWPVNVVLPFLLAVASYLVVERPILRLKDRFGHKRLATGASVEKSTAGSAGVSPAQLGEMPA